MWPGYGYCTTISFQAIIFFFSKIYTKKRADKNSKKNKQQLIYEWFWVDFQKVQSFWLCALCNKTKSQINRKCGIFLGIRRFGVLYLQTLKLTRKRKQIYEKTVKWNNFHLEKKSNYSLYMHLLLAGWQLDCDIATQNNSIILLIPIIHCG